MLHAKKKISKKELKEDALITSYMKATTFYESNKKNISIGLTTLVVLIIVFIAWMNNRNSNNEKAMTELGKVYSFYDNNQFQVAIDGVPERNISGLKSIVDNYGSSPSGDIARFYLAGAYFQTGKYDEALTAFKDCSPGDPMLVVSRLAGIAGCYEAKGQFEDAAEYFEKAATKVDKDPEAAANLNSSAYNYGLAGKKEKAIDLYKRLKKEFPTSSFARDADRFIAQFSV